MEKSYKTTKIKKHTLPHTLTTTEANSLEERRDETFNKVTTLFSNDKCCMQPGNVFSESIFSEQFFK